MQVDVLVSFSVYLQFWNVPKTLGDDLHVIGTRDSKNSDQQYRNKSLNDWSRIILEDVRFPR